MNLPNCPKCNSEYVYEDGNLLICPGTADQGTSAVSRSPRSRAAATSPTRSAGIATVTVRSSWSRTRAPATTRWPLAVMSSTDQRSSLSPTSTGRGSGPRPNATPRSSPIGPSGSVSAMAGQGATWMAARTVMPVSPAKATAHVHQMTRWCAAQSRLQ